jgi:hypothetical protein
MGLARVKNIDHTLRLVDREATTIGVLLPSACMALQVHPTGHHLARDTTAHPMAHPAEARPTGLSDTTDDTVSNIASPWPSSRCPSSC